MAVLILLSNASRRVELRANSNVNMTASTTDVKGLTAAPCTFTANWYRAGFHVSGAWDNSPAVTPNRHRRRSC